MTQLIGIDEAGRGAFAGPLVAAGVYITASQKKRLLSGVVAIRDSKTLSFVQREAVFQVIGSLGIRYVTSVIPIVDINLHGIGWANYQAIKDVIQQFQVSIKEGSLTTTEVIVDGKFPLDKIAVAGMTVTCQVDADATVLPVILAGIVAKVTRDRIMQKLHAEFPEFEWGKNKGYGTALHREKIACYGITEHHRTDFIHFFYPSD